MTAQILSMPAARRMIDLAESEKAFQQRVIDLAKACGWLCFHPFDSRKSEAGYPDLTMCRKGESPVFAELKSERGRLSKAQAAWINQLRGAGARVYIWRPSTWNEAVDVLMPHRERKPKGAA